MVVSSSFPFRYSEKFAQKLRDYFQYDPAMCQLIDCNNLQVGDRITRKIENDKLAVQIMPGLCLILCGEAHAKSSEIKTRIHCGKRLHGRFKQKLIEHYNSVQWQIARTRKQERAIEENGGNYAVMF